MLEKMTYMTNLKNYMRIGNKYIQHAIMRDISIRTKRTFVKPLSLQLFVTKKCNQRCLMCSSWREEYRFDNDLTLGDIKQLLSDAASWGVNLVTFGGGEPLVRKDIFEILDHATHLGFISSIVTNGSLIDYSMAEKLMSKNLFRIGVSLDGSNPETHDGIRGIDGSFEKTIRGLKYLVKIKKAKNIYTKLYINTVIMNKNIEEILDIVKLAKSISVDFLCQPFLALDIKIFRENSIDFTPPTVALTELIEDLIKIKKREGIILNPIAHLNNIRDVYNDKIDYNYCFAGYDHLLVAPSGDCWFCQYDMFTDKSIGNIKEKNIKEIWYSKEYDKARIKALYCMRKCSLNCSFISKGATSFIYDEFVLPIFR